MLSPTTNLEKKQLDGSSSKYPKHGPRKLKLEIEKSYKSDDAVQYVEELLLAVRQMASKGDAGEWRGFFGLSSTWDEYKELQGAIRALEQNLKMEDAAPVFSGKVPVVTIRREFHFSGQIGENRQCHRLSYTNLLHQMESVINVPSCGTCIDGDNVFCG